GLYTRLLVESFQRKLPFRRCAPIGHHPALVAPSTLEHVVEQMMIAAGGLAIDLVVPAHDRARLRTLDRDLECEQVGLAMRHRVDDRIEPMTIRLVAVERIVLERRDDALTLNAVHLLSREHRAQVRILGEILEVPAVARI